MYLWRIKSYQLSIRLNHSIRFVTITYYLYTGYKVVISGSTCTRITSLSECSEAAVALGLSDKTAEDDGSSGKNGDPPYCFFEDDELKFNSDGTNTGDCKLKDACLCIEGRYISEAI